MLVRPRRKACLSEAQDERRTTESFLSLLGRDPPHICSTVWGGPDGGVQGSWSSLGGTAGGAPHGRMHTYEILNIYLIQLIPVWDI